MDSFSDFEESEQFFEQGEAGTYADGPTRLQSLSPVELELETKPLVTDEQLARAARFRKPVAILVGVLAAGLLILLARAPHASETAQLASGVDVPSTNATAQRALTTSVASTTQGSAAPLAERAIEQPASAAPLAERAPEQPASAAISQSVRSPSLSSPSAREEAARSGRPVVTAVRVLRRATTHEPAKPAAGPPRETTAASLTLVRPSVPGASPTARFPDLPH